VSCALIHAFFLLSSPPLQPFSRSFTAARWPASSRRSLGRGVATTPFIACYPRQCSGAVATIYGAGPLPSQTTVSAWASPLPPKMWSQGSWASQYHYRTSKPMSLCVVDPCGLVRGREGS
jgi:hypothetical protein